MHHRYVPYGTREQFNRIGFELIIQTEQIIDALRIAYAKASVLLPPGRHIP
jgi:hypothetical protein